MQCPNCRQTTPADAAFCGNCGAPVTVGSAEQAAVSAERAVVLSAESFGGLTRDHSRKAVVGFIVAICGLFAWLVPLAGLLFGLTGLILGTIAFHSKRRVFARSGIALSAVVLAASLFMWVHSVQRLAGTAQADSTPASDGALQNIITPCYSTKLWQRMQLSASDGSCSFQANDPLTGERDGVKVLSVPGLQASNLNDAAEHDVLNVVKSIPGSKLAWTRSVLFAGSPSYQAEVLAADGSGGLIDYVYYPAVQGNLLVITRSQVHVDSQRYDLGILETDWSWQ